MYVCQRTRLKSYVTCVFDEDRKSWYGMHLINLDTIFLLKTTASCLLLLPFQRCRIAGLLQFRKVVFLWATVVNACSMYKRNAEVY